nr:putative sugar-non-specific nuclease NucA [uncultured bacterium]
MNYFSASSIASNRNLRTKIKQVWKARAMRGALIVAIFALVILPSIILVRAAISLSTTTAATQNFDSIGTSATATLPADFKVDRLGSVRTVGTYAAAATATTQVGGANVSTTATNGIYNFGSGTTTTGADRAIGFISSGSGTTSGNIYAQYINNSGGNLSGLRVSYDVEKYRNGLNAAGFRIQLFYSTDGTNWTSAGSNFLTAFSADANNNGFATAPGATVAVTDQVLTAAIPNGSDFYLAWNYSVTTGSTVTNAQGLAVDNISVLGISDNGETSPTGVGSANPNSVEPGNSTLLTVAVTPGANPTSTGLAVTANLIAIGGSATQTFFDNGTNGDVTAGDNIFSFQTTVAPGTSGGAKTLPATITDAESRSGNANISLTVLAPAPPSGVGAASPSTVQPGGMTRLTVTVTPGTIPPSTGITVTGDLSLIGGSATQTFFDNGTNGDLTAGDNIFTFSTTVTNGTTIGLKSLPVSIADAQSRTATTTISLNVQLNLYEHLVMGNPSGATADVQNENNYLMQKVQYALSYNRSRAIPNWTSWHLDSTWRGSAPRQDDYRNDTELPAGWYQVLGTDYANSGFDRGHMCPSADRTSSIPDNSATFLMTNMIPQAPDNNQGPWEQLESYLRTLLPDNEIYIISGSTGVGGVGSNGAASVIASGHVTVPEKTWKVALVLPVGNDDVNRVTTSARTIAVIMPNIQGIRSDAWQKYLATVDQVEALTGYDFFSSVSPSIQDVFETKLDLVNDTAPVANSQSVTTAEDTSKAITLIATDTNINNVLSYSIVSGPAHGLLTGSGANLTYQPAADYFGPDSFTFKASDGTLESSTVTVTITVTSVNDAPVTVADSKSVVQDNVLTFPASDLTTNDSPGAGESSQTLTVTTVTATASTHGNVALNSGTVTYTPTTGYFGPASFTYTVCDNGTTNGAPDSKCTTGTVNVTVTPTGQPGCTFTLGATSQNFAAAAGTGSVTVQTTAGCNWTAVSNDGWITVTSGASGTGSGTVQFSVAANSTSSIRSGTITIAGQTFTVSQGIDFLDVPPSNPFYNEIGKLAARGVTLGCGGGNFCPDAVVTRDQMAAFIMRARGEFNPPTPGTQRFPDVPPSNPFYAFVDRMAELQITLGCGGGNYCPSDVVLREQMAAFMIRGLHEPGYVPPTPGSQRFNDVPPSNPFYAYIEEMATRAVTLGCSSNPPMYCPGSVVTRAQMAAFLVRAFNL